MSASPADRTPGRTPGRTPNGGPAPLLRRPRNADPLVRPKDKQKRRPPRPLPGNGPPSSQVNGLKVPSANHSLPNVQAPGRPPPPAPRPLLTSQPDNENAVSGFSSKPVGDVQDFPLILSKRALMDGFRHHVARFSSRRPVDPRNTEEFVRPVRLHRRDPKAQPVEPGIKGEDVVMGGQDDVDDKQKEKDEILKAEREAAREAEAALVAPAVNNTGQRRLGGHMKKTEQIFRNDQTDEQKARSKLRYEEALPWHLEDFDNKSTWVGSYEAALSDTYAMMVQGTDGAYRVLPLEKWYKFTQKNQFKTLTIEEAETRYNKKIKEPRWFMDSEESRIKRQSEQTNKKSSSGLFLGKWEKGGGSGGLAAPAVKPESADADDLDFIEDRFADDEENMLFEDDDETKEAEERIKRDQLQANVFDLKEEKEYEKQEQLERKEKDEEKKLGKNVKKALMKREKNYIYDSDSTDNPYSSESESTSSEAERQKEVERQKSDNKATPEKPSLTTKSKHQPGSGASSKGTNTPSHRPSKHPSPHPLPRTASSSSLKRPGSPLASDASGNESAARKKLKKKHLAPGGSTAASAGQPNLQPPSRPTSPASSLLAAQVASRASNCIPSKRSFGAGSGSDTEGANAASGGEMSDGTRKRIRLKISSKKSRDASPEGSRAHSPDAAPTAIASTGDAASRVANAANSAPTTRPPSPPFPTAEDVRAHIPPTGIKMGELLAHFRGQIVGDERKGRFTRLMRENSRFIKETKMLVPLEPK